MIDRRSPDPPDALLVDCRWVGTRGGVGRVVQHLLRGVRDLDASGELESAVGPSLVLWGPPGPVEDASGELPPGVRVAPSRRVGHEWVGQRDFFGLPAHRGALYLHQLRPLRDWSSATLIHDTIPLRQGSAIKRRVWRRLLRDVAHRSGALLTVSEHSRRSIAADLGVDPATIVRVHLPMDRHLAARVRARRAERGAGTDLLYVGRFDANKNLPGLIAAFGASGRHRDAQLHLFGPAPQHRSTLLDVARQHGVRNVVIAERTDDDDLVTAYAGAAAVVAPSFEEGWGLGPYEAVACGIPVVASDRGALPEVAAYATTRFDLVDITQPGALAAAIAEVQPADVETMDAASLAAEVGSPTSAELARVALATARAARPAPGR